MISVPNRDPTGSAPAQPSSTSGTAEQVAPGDALERQLLAIWAEALETDNIRVEDDFFALGGHSLLALQVVSICDEEFGIPVSLADLFDHPTVASLGNWLKEERAARD